MNQLIEIVKNVLGSKFANLGPDHWLTLGARLLPIVPDLIDGDPRLSPEHRLDIEDVLAEFEKDFSL